MKKYSPDMTVLDVFRDRIIAYASFAYQFCILFDQNQAWTSFAFSGGNKGNVEVKWSLVTGLASATGLNYWYLQCGLSYPIQKVMQGIKSIIEQ